MLDPGRDVDPQQVPAQLERLDRADARDESGGVVCPLLERESEEVEPDLAGPLAECRQRGPRGGRAVLQAGAQLASRSSVGVPVAYRPIRSSKEGARLDFHAQRCRRRHRVAYGAGAISGLRMSHSNLIRLHSNTIGLERT